MESLTPHELDIARGTVTRRKLKRLLICRGTLDECKRFPKTCDGCYVIFPDDARSSAEILEAMRRGNG